MRRRDALVRLVKAGLVGAAVLGCESGAEDSSDAAGGSGGAGGLGGSGLGGVSAPDAGPITGGTDAAGPVLPRVAIVGGGMAGMATAWLLDGACEVTLFEAAPTVGGNALTRTIDVRGVPYAVDLGAQYFNRSLHRRYVTLLDLLGVLPADSPDAAREVAMTMTVYAPGEDTPRFVSPLPPTRLWPINEAWNQEAIVGFNKLVTEAAKLESEDVSYEMPLEQWFVDSGFEPGIVSRLLAPWAASIGTTRLADLPAHSARAVLAFLAAALRPGGLPLAYYGILPGGMGTVVASMAERLTTATVRVGAAVTGLSRDAAGVGVVAGGAPEVFDRVVLATHGDVTARLLRGLPGAETLADAVAGVGFFDARLALHRDPRFVPADPRYASIINTGIGATGSENSMMLDALLPAHPDGQPVSLWKSWITHRTDTPPADVIETIDFRHMAPTLETVRAQARIRAAAPLSGVELAGAWLHPLELQETAVTSALDAAERIAPDAAHLVALRAALG